MSDRTPRQRWGTCCPHDPECCPVCRDLDALRRWMDTPISDDAAFEQEAADERTAEERMPQ